MTQIDKSIPMHIQVLLGAMKSAMDVVIERYNHDDTRLFQSLLVEPFINYNINNKIAYKFNTNEFIAINAMVYNKYKDLVNDDYAISCYHRQMQMFYRLVSRICYRNIRDGIYRKIRDGLNTKLTTGRITMDDLDGATIGQFYCDGLYDRSLLIFNDMREFSRCIKNYIIEFKKPNKKQLDDKSFVENVIRVILDHLILVKEIDISRHIYSRFGTLIQGYITNQDFHMCTRDGRIIHLSKNEVPIYWADYKKVIYDDVLHPGDTIHFYKMLFFGCNLFRDFMCATKQLSFINCFEDDEGVIQLLYKDDIAVKVNANELYNKDYPDVITYDGNMEHLYTYCRYYLDCNLRYKVLIDDLISLVKKEG